MIHCIGDSHCRLFTGTNRLNSNENLVPGFIVSNVSSHLAYNVCDENHPLRTTIVETWQKHPADSVVFFFGEIDCRAHIPKHARSSNLLTAVEDCVDRYVDGLKQMEALLTPNVAAFAPHIAQNKGGLEHMAGTWEEIKAATLLFDNVLRERYERVASINDWLVENEAWNKKEFYIDTNHLSIKCLEPAIAEVTRVLYL